LTLKLIDLGTKRQGRAKIEEANARYAKLSFSSHIESKECGNMKMILIIVCLGLSAYQSNFVQLVFGSSLFICGTYSTMIEMSLKAKKKTEDLCSSVLYIWLKQSMTEPGFLFRL
jgi:hypothetical protein